MPNKIRYSHGRHDAPVIPTFSCSLDVEPLEPATYSRRRRSGSLRNATRQRYALQPDSASGTAGEIAVSPELFAQLMKALEQTEWVKWIRLQMSKGTMAKQKPAATSSAPPEVRSQRDEPEKLSAGIDDVNDVAGLKRDGKKRANRMECAEPAPPVMKRYSSQSTVDDPVELFDKAKSRYEKACESEVRKTCYQRQRTDDVDRYSRRASAHNELVNAHDDVTMSRKDLADQAMQHAQRHGTSYEDALTAVGGSMPQFIPTSSPV